MGHSGVVVLQGADFAIVDMDAVGRQDFGFEQSLFLDIGHHRHIVLVAHVFHFEGGFGNVRMQGHIKFSGQFGGGFQDFSGAGVRGVRGHCRDD